MTRGGHPRSRHWIGAEESSGNIFRDIGFPHAEREQLKADFTLQIYCLVKQRGLTQTLAGAPTIAPA